MSRNKKRIQVQQQRGAQKQPTQPPPQAIPEPPPQQSNPFGISFVVQTEIVKLPSGGLLYEPGNPLRGVKQVEVKAVTAAEEDIVINDSFIQQGIVFDKLIDAILITPDISAKDMMDCDKMAILISARKTGYGDLVNFGLTCSVCASHYETEVSLSSILEKNENKEYQLSSDEDCNYLESSNTFSFNLPSTGLEVNMKLLGPAERQALVDAKEQKERLNLPFNETLEFLRMVLVSVQGVVDRTSINKLCEVLPAQDARKIKEIHSRNIPKIDTMQKVTCPHCDHEEEKEVPFSLGWFWSN